MTAAITQVGDSVVATSRGLRRAELGRGVGARDRFLGRNLGGIEYTGKPIGEATRCSPRFAKNLGYQRLQIRRTSTALPEQPARMRRI